MYMRGRSTLRMASAVLLGAAITGGALAAPPHSQWFIADRPATLTAPVPSGGAGPLVQYADRAAFLDATNGIELAFEDFGAGFTPPTGLRICFQAVTSASDDPCFKPGDLVSGFGIRSTRGSIFDSQARDIDVVVLGAQVLGTPGVVIGSNVPGPPPDPVRISFDAGATAVALDAYDGRTGAPLTVSAFDADDALIGSFVVTPSAINTPAFAGFTSPIPVTQVTIAANASNGGALIGNLHFGGGAGQLELDPAALDFGATVAGGATSLPLSLSNGGDLDLTIGSLAAPPPPFSVTADACSGTTLTRGQGCTVQIAFEPQHALPYAAALTIPSSDPQAPNRGVELAGQGVLARLSGLPGNVDFGSVAVGGSVSADVALANLGAAAVTVSAISALAAPFAHGGGTCGAPPFDLASGTQCSLGLSFAPASAGAYSGTLVITSSASTPQLTVNLYGEGAGARNGGRP